jgi:hypothetical protein
VSPRASSPPAEGGGSDVARYVDACIARGRIGVAIARDLIDGRLPSEFAGEVAEHAVDAEGEVLETSRGMRTTRLRESRSGSVPGPDPDSHDGGWKRDPQPGPHRSPASPGLRFGR